MQKPQGIRLVYATLGLINYSLLSPSDEEPDSAGEEAGRLRCPDLSVPNFLICVSATSTDALPTAVSPF